MPKAAQDDPVLILSEEEIDAIQHQYPEKTLDVTEWSPWQEKILTCMADEIGLFGGKGSGKSAAMRGWLVSGNPHIHENTPFNRSYIHHPEYYALILRRNEKDLKFFIRAAQRMWRPLGAEYKNGYFDFPSGARIECGHMAHEDSWQKYIGNEYVRVVIDEAGLIPDYGVIEELRSGMRTPHQEMRRQIMYASNCGGPGTHWIIDRFMNVKDENGNLIPHDTNIVEHRKHPFTGKAETRTRIWMFATVRDNPWLASTSYATDLEGLQDPKRKAAYFEGRWDALFGSYFGDLFRPNGPIKDNNEPANANHVLKADPITRKYPIEIKPWHHITMGGDWGYAHEAAFLWARQLPDKQVVIYRELVADQTMPDKLGFEIARLSREELEALPSHSLTVFLGHDAFNTRAGARTIAELIAAGIAKVLGPNAVHLPDLLIKRLREGFQTEAFNPWERERQEKALDAVRLQRRTGITLRVAEKTSVIGWQYCRDLLRWESAGTRNNAYDASYARHLLQIDPKAFVEYSSTWKPIKNEVLPRLKIFDCCPRLIEAIPRAQHEDGTEAMDSQHFKGRDSVDSLSYLVSGLVDETPQEPFEAFRDRSLEDITTRYPEATTNDLCRINRQLEEEWAKKDAGFAPYTPPRQARARRLMLRGKLQPVEKSIDEYLGIN